jgi:hypothetical protein
MADPQTNIEFRIAPIDDFWSWEVISFEIKRQFVGMRRRV